MRPTFRNFAPIMKRLLSILTMTAVALTIGAQTAREEISANIYLAGSNYLDYDRQLPTLKLTPAPKGYEPYYMSHYGRHGSRWLISENSYIGPLTTMRDADSQGKLTQKGKDVLRILEEFYPCTIDRLGDLSTVGERQHHGIGKRMVQNFPEIFKTKDVAIDARSTVVIRCILSMTAECEELMAANPTARIHNDVSEALQYYLNAPWPDRLRKQTAKRNAIREQYRQKLTHTKRLMGVLFNDQQWVSDNLRAASFTRQLFEIAVNMQSHDTDLEMLSLFTADEVYDLWKQNNIGWYLEYGPAPQTESIMPFSQLNLLKNIIETTDTVTQTQATLRFGHEVCVMPLACLLELDNCGAKVEDLDHLEDTWRNYKIFPMGCNIQLVFYRPKKGKTGEVLVKALLNEREARLPIQTTQWPYYSWKELRQYYLDKIQRFEAGNK